MRIIIAIICLNLCAFSLNAQSYTTKKTAKGKALKAYKKGMEYNIQGANTKAIREFERAISADPTFIDANIQYAALHYVLEQFDAAEKGFEKVVEIDGNYNPKVYYSLALAEMHQRKFGEASKHFQDFLDSDSKNEALRKKANKHLANCAFLEKAYSHPVDFKPENLGENINTKSADYLPCLTADGQTLIFASRIDRGQEDFYISTKENGEWQPSKPLTAINTELNEAAQSISADGKFMVFTACDRRGGKGTCDLYYSEVKNGEWTPTTNIGAPINTKYWESQPSISADGSTLYFVSNRPGGKGEKDIWVSQRDRSGKWSEPNNLGEMINTEEEDKAPFIHPDGQTLYFTSDGHPTIGGQDLFYSRKDEKGEWQKPENLGYPINTTGHDVGLIISLDGKTAYFSSDRAISEQENFDPEREDKGDNMDIYSFELYPEARPQPVTYVKAKIFDAKTKKPLASNVEFIDLSRNAIHAASITEEDGEFLVCLPIGKDYSLNVSKEKYFFHSENFALAENLDQKDPYLLEIYLQPIPENIMVDNGQPTIEAPTSLKPIVLKNVFFETASAELKAASITELQHLKELLEAYPQMRIQLNGHTDNIGSDADNLALSDGRAKAVYNYLIDNGIAASRLSYKGFGETKPIESNETEEGRQSNRRTEFEVIR